MVRYLLIVAVASYVLYFPGRQKLLAIHLATGLGLAPVQARIDHLEDKAIANEPFSPRDVRFLRDLYSTMATGARLTVFLRQSGQLMEHYLEGGGDDLVIEPRIFLGSPRVRVQIEALTNVVRTDAMLNRLQPQYVSPVFYMGDPAYLESFIALAWGRLSATPEVLADGRVRLHWQADMPWQWLSYDQVYQRFGRYHAMTFPLPNVRSVLFGRRHALHIDDGLGEHLVHLGLAKPFHVRATWESEVRP